MRIREFDAALDKIRSQKSLRSLDFPHFNEQIRPFGILNVDCDGNYSTYSPELLGMNVSPYGSFSFGNILTDDFVEAAESPKFRSVFTDIQSGINLCRESCAYYGYCGGGAPANKYYENGELRDGGNHFLQVQRQAALGHRFERSRGAIGSASATDPRGGVKANRPGLAGFAEAKLDDLRNPT